MSESYLEGFNAFIAGKAENDNPYPKSSTNFLMWELGFKESAIVPF